MDVKRNLLKARSREVARRLNQSVKVGEVFGSYFVIPWRGPVTRACGHGKPDSLLNMSIGGEKLSSLPKRPASL